jgi:hypothetical protein
MTTPPQHTDTADPGAGSAPTPAGPATEQVSAPEQAQDAQFRAPAEQPIALPAEQVAAPDSTNGTIEDRQESLFDDDQLSGLKSRWTDVQAGFVDDPRECVQKADGLVSDVVDQLTSSFSQARSRLEEQWARGEKASTEDLRLALQRYRQFFERLLAV